MLQIYMNNMSKKRSWQSFNGIITKANSYANYWTVFISSYRSFFKFISEKGHFIQLLISRVTQGKG